MRRTTATDRLSRRTVLRGAGALLALPWFESVATAATNSATRPKRFVGMYHTNGVNPYKWYPETAGRDYVMPENLALLKSLRDDLTVFSGLAHWRSPQSAGHWGLTNLLTGCGNGGGVQFHTSVSLDQLVAPKIGADTRIQSLNLSSKTGVGALNERIVTMSFGARGNPLPTESSPRKIFEQLFVDPSAAEKANIRNLQSRNQSILDNLQDEAKRLNRRLGKRDQQKLDDYLSNVRSVEKQMQRDDEWLDADRFKVGDSVASRMANAERFDFDLMLELIYLALVSDTTRVITFTPMPEGGLYHGASHWNKNPEKSLPEMDIWDRKWIGGLASLAGRLKATDEEEGDFLDTTAILYGGGHGRRPHFAHDLPLVLVGGKSLGFRHGQHLAFAPLGEDRNAGSERKEEFLGNLPTHRKTPAANLLLSVANALGVPTRQFADSTGRLDGLH